MIINFLNQDGLVVRTTTMDVQQVNALLAGIPADAAIPNFDGGWDIFLDA